MDESEIDDSLYSRQRYVLGDSAMQKMAKSNIFLSGIGGLGAEIAKNICLAGVKSISLCDPHPASWMDLSSQFFLTEDDVAKDINRVEASLSKLAELNPYVSVNRCTQSLDMTCDLSFFNGFDCVILTNSPLDFQLRVNKFCRSQAPPIKFISCAVRGVFSNVFCDFGPDFTIYDNNGEEPAEFFVGGITKAIAGVVKCLENRSHNLETGDMIKFGEVVGMEAVNGTTHTVKVIDPGMFSIGDTSGAEFGEYQHGGIARQVKATIQMKFESLSSQLKEPDLLLSDLSKLDTPMQAHLAFLTLAQFLSLNGTLPKPRDDEDAETFVKLAGLTNTDLQLVSRVDEKLLRQFAWACMGTFPPLAATVGGLVAQEALKAVTGKFTPLHQWLYIDACEVLASQEDAMDPTSFMTKGDRYDAVRVCLGESTLQKLANLKLFMVGCGAIGCEMLKNYAMMGVGRKPLGLITITDNDIIEKSNLNRQFLFRSHHIQKSKSVVAAVSTLAINPDLCLEALQYKVFPQTEAKTFHDTFFQAQDLVVNALDNVEARRYVDSRCVSNQRSLLESGTMGTKGHVQVIVPHKTESYSSQRDPPDEDVPYCTLKSFPATIEHTIQWARDKFELLFTQKPSMYSKFWETHGKPDTVLQILHNNRTPDGVVKVVKMASVWPGDWASCVRLARVKFEKYFNHKAKDLLLAFPVDTRLKDGTLFWQSPKRPPNHLIFDINDTTHFSFIVSMARLWADICAVPYRVDQDLDSAVVIPIIQDTALPEYKCSTKEIITDESAKKPESKADSMDIIEATTESLATMCSSGFIKERKLKMVPQSFEKDDDGNGHMDFVTAASNLRAAMYSIDAVDRFKTKLIAGKIVPAIATTTAAVAGLASIELVKVVLKQPLENLKNAFLNLSLPSLVFSEPAPPIKTVITQGYSFTLWDRWEVQGSSSMTLQEFMKALKHKYGMEPTMVVLGVKMIYVPYMPGHSKRLTKLMTQLLKCGPDTSHVDLTVSFEMESREEKGEVSISPPVRYHLRTSHRTVDCV